METLRDNALREKYMTSCCVRDYFSLGVPDFLLLHFSPGELLSSSYSRSPYLQFVVDGDLLLYDMQDEESAITIQTTHNEVSILGDMELLDAAFVPFFVEARTDVYTLALPLSIYRQQLLNDPVFLRHICRILAEKLNGAVASNSRSSLRVKVTHSLRHAEVGQRITDIAHLAASINVSPRQLLRVLKEFCAEGILQHEKKGVYILLKKP